MAAKAWVGGQENLRGIGLEKLACILYRSLETRLEAATGSRSVILESNATCPFQNIVLK